MNDQARKGFELRRLKTVQFIQYAECKYGKDANVWIQSKIWKKK